VNTLQQIKLIMYFVIISVFLTKSVARTYDIHSLVYTYEEI